MYIVFYACKADGANGAYKANGHQFALFLLVAAPVEGSFVVNITLVLGIFEAFLGAAASVASRARDARADALRAPLTERYATPLTAFVLEIAFAVGLAFRAGLARGSAFARVAGFTDAFTELLGAALLVAGAFTAGLTAR